MAIRTVGKERADYWRPEQPAGPQPQLWRSAMQAGRAYAVGDEALNGAGQFSFLQLYNPPDSNVVAVVRRAEFSPITLRIYASLRRMDSPQGALSANTGVSITATGPNILANPTCVLRTGASGALLGTGFAKVTLPPDNLKAVGPSESEFIAELFPGCGLMLQSDSGAAGASTNIAVAGIFWWVEVAFRPRRDRNEYVFTQST